MNSVVPHIFNKTKTLFTLALIGSITLANAQSPKSKTNKANAEYPDKTDDIRIPEAIPMTDSEGIEVSPEFPGGTKAFSNYIRKNLKWPAGTKVPGKVLIGFTVGRDGRTSMVKVIHSLSPACNSEAVRVVKNSPRWVPGKRTVDGKHWKPYPVTLTLPIVFSLK